MIARSSPSAGRRGGGCACGCLGLLAFGAASLLIGALVIWPRLPNLAAQAVGFQERGAVEAVFEAVTPLPTPVLVNLAPAGPVTISAGTLGSGTLTGSEGVPLQLGSDPSSGAAGAVVALTEYELLGLCQRYADICMSDPRFQNPSVDLRPGGAVVYADVSLPELGGLSQRAGVVLRVDSTGRALEVAGIDLGGVLYAVPSNQIGQLVLNAQAQVNNALAQFVVDTGAGRLALDRISVDDSVVTLTLR